ncbi:hypothetical protein LVD15_08465 [Fulvivirga maritima]|uniref:hypothetical protein n=1 Tax=Fulvivirga maritima TaxID=2904247 RepID=UPI001F1ACDC1|nr:hypothetical protein [Fulvivirga maritima]UII28449.1 hypothetical protein LVD15_08465 [Fulvivirga maritima]
MWQKVLYPLFAFFLVTGLAYSQSDTEVERDSVRHLLDESRAKQVLGISDEFQMAYLKMSADQRQSVVKRLVGLMNSRTANTALRDSYLNTIAKSLNSENTASASFQQFLEVTEKVLDNYPPDKISKYLKTTGQFFEWKALYFARSNRLFTDGDYTFEFVEVAEPEETIEIETVDEYDDSDNYDDYEDDNYEDDDEYWDNWDDEPADDDWDTEWNEVYEEQTELEDQQMIQAIQSGGAVMPIIEGPVIKFDNVNLNFVSAYDSVFLENTSGSFLILKDQFVGNGGKFDWTMAGLGADSVYCSFPEYSFDTRKARLKVESAKLTYTGKIDEPVEGIFEYKSVRHDSTNDSHYPRFISYYSDIKVKNIGKDLIYHGGFSLDGAKINSASVMGTYSMIEVRNDQAQKFKARAPLFEFGDSVVTAKRAAVVIYQNYDSIYHPALRLKYDYENQKLVLQKDKGGFRNTPFVSSYFNIDFTADLIRWDLQSDSLNASIMEAARMVPLNIESADHYSYDDYSSLGDRIYPFNPLAMVVAYSRKEGVDEFYVDELAKSYKKDIDVMKGAMLFLAQKGLIGYDSNKRLITVKDKAKHLFNSRFGKKDYDNIIISSVIHYKPNATLNFPKNYMKVRGVESFKVSDSLNVIIEPDSSEITLMEDRDIMFNGKISAGNFEYIGEDFYFEYDSFLINMGKIFSIQFYVQDEKTHARTKVDNSMVAVPDEDSPENTGATQGTLYINRPNNKSAKVKYANYPKFNAGQGALVYFDREEILGGVYDKSLKFEVPPFDIDSLSGEDPSSIEFGGGFKSGGIFPDFEEKLIIMPDNTLGFKHQVPQEGYMLYNDPEATYFEEVTLNKKGLQGKGELQYLSANLKSDNFIFYPDSVTGNGDYLHMEESDFNGNSYPQTSVENYSMKWVPAKDRMYIKNEEEPIKFYNETATLDGTAIISKEGMFGGGTLLTRGSESKSKSMKFENDRFSARHADFELKSDNPDKPALHGDDVRLRFNLGEDYAVISPEVEGQDAIEFPFAQFKTSISEARWDLVEDKVTMTKPDDVPLESSYFYTTRKDLDSLRFNATNAEYDIKTSELKVSGIPYIVVADAKITPENNEVLILENAKIGRLTNTTIVLDTLYEYHTLTEGVIDIISRNEFTGYATYNFVNALNDTVPVKMENFHLEKFEDKNSRKKDAFEMHTVANGTIDGDQNILISPGMFYKGDVIMYANRPTMELDGFIKLDIHEPDYDTWIVQKSTGEQQEVMIDFDNTLTEGGQKLQAGLYYNIEDNSLYNTFLSDDIIDDDPFFAASGMLSYEKETGEFAIEDTLKAAGKSFQGKVYKYNQDTKTVKFEGPVNLVRPDEDFVLKATAIGNGNIETNEYTLNSLITVDIANVPTMAFDAMARDIKDVITNLGAPEGLGDPTQLLYKLGDMIGERPTKEYEKLSKEEHVPLGGFAKETSAPLTFTNVDLKWSTDYNAFYSEGKLGLSNIRSTDLNASLEGFMEITKNEGGGTIFNLFLKASPASWFFFSYEDDQLLVFSSNNIFNDVINKKSNGAKAKIGDLVFAPADKAETLNFINRFRLQYYGIDDIYDLDSEIEPAIEDLPDDGFGGAQEDDGFDDGDDGF